MNIAPPRELVIEPRRSFWQRDTSLRRTRPALNENTSVEFAIIGGGLAGLTTAIAILDQKPTAEVVVLESKFVGFGASGRSGGLLSPFPAPIWIVGATSNDDQRWGLKYVNQRMHETASWLRTHLPNAPVH